MCRRDQKQVKMSGAPFRKASMFVALMDLNTPDHEVMSKSYLTLTYYSRTLPKETAKAP